MWNLDEIVVAALVPNEGLGMDVGTGIVDKKPMIFLRFEDGLCA